MKKKTRQIFGITLIVAVAYHQLNAEDKTWIFPFLEGNFIDLLLTMGGGCVKVPKEHFFVCFLVFVVGIYSLGTIYPEYPGGFGCIHLKISASSTVLHQESGGILEK